MIKEIIKQLEVPGKLIYLTQYGSHLYGLNTENSDLDFRGVFIPNREDVLLKRDVDEYNTELVLDCGTNIEIDNIGCVDIIKNPGFQKKVDVKLFSIYKFLKLCSKGDTNALDVLFSVVYGAPTQIMKTHVEQFYDGLYIDDEQNPWWIIEHIKEYANKLINTSNLSSPITYAHKQAEKYSVKGERLNKINEVYWIAKEIIKMYERTSTIDDMYIPVVEDLAKRLKSRNILDNKHVKIDELNNKGKIEKYLYVGGVQHQFNLPLETFVQRVKFKLDKEYTSVRTKNASDGNDWKALSHALRILLQVKELLNTGNITFPNKDVTFLKNVKLGKVSREDIDNYFNENLEDVLIQVQNDKLGWCYDEKFWDEFLLRIL